MRPLRAGFQPGCPGQQGGSSYNPQAGRAGRPSGAGSTAPRLALGSSALQRRSAFLLLLAAQPPPPLGSRRQPLVARGGRKGSLGRRLLLAAGASSRRPAPPGRGKEGDGDGGRMEPGAGPGP